MKLYMSANSPYARKVRIVVAELGRQDLVEERAVNAREPSFWAVNPVGRIPALQLDDGGVLGESDLICDYLTTTLEGGAALRCDDFGRMAVLGLANGVLDTGMVARVEGTRPGASDTDAFTAKHLDAVRRALDALEKAKPRTEDVPDLADIATVCAVDWIAFRHPNIEPLKDRPRLAERVGVLSQRPALKTTAPG